MAELIFKCKHCSTSIASDDKLCGDIIVCPNCEKEVVIPIPGIEAGVELGDFKLLTLLGRGASGEVWLAFQNQMQRKVALKILNPTLAKNKTFMERFRKEAVLSAKLHHPNIVTAYYCGEEKGLSYLAVTYVDGKTIEDYLEEGVIFGEQEALNIIRQIAEALKYAWDEWHIVHRDIKPANIMISKKGIPMLLDLGISKDTSSDMALTLTGTVVGTPYYMSPEQAVGDKSIDFRTDIYALGTTLYHMLTGKVPYHATTSMAIIMKHLNDTYVPPSSLNPDVSENCCRLIAVMMAKNKPERPESWQALIDDIEQVLKGNKPLTPMPSKNSFSKTTAKVDVSSSAQKKNNKYLFITLAVITTVILITVLVLAFSPNGDTPESQAPVKDSSALKETLPVRSDKASFREIAEKLIDDGSDKSAKNWEKIKGRKFTWQGRFVLYRERFLNDPEVRVAVPCCKLYNDYNVVLVTPEKDKASAFKPQQDLSFTGIVYKYKAKKDGTVVIYMKDVKFL
jgi:serine/threonine-protein kinase